MYFAMYLKYHFCYIASNISHVNNFMKFVPQLFKTIISINSKMCIVEYSGQNDIIDISSDFCVLFAAFFSVRYCYWNGLRKHI